MTSSSVRCVPSPLLPHPIFTLTFSRCDTISSCLQRFPCCGRRVEVTHHSKEERFTIGKYESMLCINDGQRWAALGRKAPFMHLRDNLVHYDNRNDLRFSCGPFMTLIEEEF